MSFETVNPVEQKIADKSNEIIEASKNLDTVLSERFELEKKLVEIREVSRKARFNLSRMREEKEGLIREFWRAKENR